MASHYAPVEVATDAATSLESDNFVLWAVVAGAAYVAALAFCFRMGAIVNEKRV